MKPARLATSAAVLLSLAPAMTAWASTGTPARPHTATATYVGASFISTPAGDTSLPSFTATSTPVGPLNLLSAELAVAKTDRFVSVSLDDDAGGTVGARVTFNDARESHLGGAFQFCGTSAKFPIPPGAAFLEVRPGLLGQCASPATHGTVTAVLYPAPAKRKR